MIRSWIFAIAVAAVATSCKDGGPPTTRLGSFPEELKTLWESRCRTTPSVRSRDEEPYLVGVAPLRFKEREVAHFSCKLRGAIPLGGVGSTTHHYDGTMELYWDVATGAVTSFSIDGYEVDAKRFVDQIEPLVLPLLPPEEWKEIRTALLTNRKLERRARDGSFIAWISTDEFLDGPRSWSLRIAAQ